MKMFNPKDLSSILRREKQCKFNNLCSIFSHASYTCTHVGGEYCGKYRALQQTNNKGSISNNTEQNLILS